MNDLPKSGKTTSIRSSDPLSVSSDGSRVESSGAVTVDVGSIRSVGIENLLHVKEHAITRIVGSTSHFIKFFDGGELRFAYNEHGRLLEFTGHRVTMSVKSGHIMVMQWTGS